MAKHGGSSGIYKDIDTGEWVVPGQDTTTGDQRRNVIRKYKTKLKHVNKAASSSYNSSSDTHSRPVSPKTLTGLPAELRMKIYEMATKDYQIRTALYFEHSSEWAFEKNAQQQNRRWKTVGDLQVRFVVKFEPPFDAHGLGFDALAPKSFHVHAGLLRANKLIRGEFIEHLSTKGVKLEAYQLGGSCEGCGCFETLADLVPAPWTSAITTVQNPLRGIVQYGFPALKSIETTDLSCAGPYWWPPKTVMTQKETIPDAEGLLGLLQAASLESCTEKLMQWFGGISKRTDREITHNELDNVRWVRRMRLGHINAVLRYTDSVGKRRRFIRSKFDHFAVCSSRLHVCKVY
jgi:hypothetical protein